MSKWTPGPWTVDGPPDNQIVWSGPDERVCFLAHSNGRDDERDIATGHLIASAPDLAEALENALAAGLPEDVAVAGRAALRRAKGEA